MKSVGIRAKIEEGKEDSSCGKKTGQLYCQEKGGDKDDDCCESFFNPIAKPRAIFGTNPVLLDEIVCYNGGYFHGITTLSIFESILIN